MIKVMPFSNSTEFAIWKHNNCDKCSQYECTSRIRAKSKCKLAFDLDFASIIDGKISINTAKWIGYSDEKLNDKCNMKNITFGPAKFNAEIFKQMKLF